MLDTREWLQATEARVPLTIVNSVVRALLELLPPCTFLQAFAELKHKTTMAIAIVTFASSHNAHRCC